ncbi:hypothetical protein H8958_017148, partial [Nasalis larvatus]
GRCRGSHELIITEERCGFCVSFNFSRIKSLKLKKYTCPGLTRDSPTASLQPGRARFAFSHVCHTPLHSTWRASNKETPSPAGFCQPPEQKHGSPWSPPHHPHPDLTVH